MRSRAEPLLSQGKGPPEPGGDGAPRGLVAITGASGFIGRRIVARLRAAGWPLRALIRREDAALVAAGVDLVRGALDDRSSLERLVADAAVVIHCAGAIRAPSRRAFARVNAAGTAALAAAARGAAAGPRVLLVSSLAAREPQLSAYAATKRMAEDELRARADHLGDFAILRPPAVYGPGDRATLPIFRQLERGLMFVPAVAGARFSLIYVDDLAAIVARLLELECWDGLILEPHDGREHGYGWRDLAEIGARHLGRRVRTVAVPRQVLWAPAAIGHVVGAVVGRPPALTPGKLREFYHADWLCREGTAPGLEDPPATTFESGFARTLAWYRRERWL